MSNSPLLECHNLSKTYREGRLATEVLKQVSFSIQPGDLMAIVGSSGSGKSTLLHLLGGLDTPTSGDVFFKQQALSSLSSGQLAKLRNRELGFIYQFHHLLPDFTALENVAMPLLIGGMNGQQASAKALAMLTSVGLAKRSEHRPSELSGGERQRVAIARALVNEPALVMADEPTGNLDQKTAESIFALLKTLNAEKGTAFLVVTHDLMLAQEFDRQLEMRDGQLNSELTLLGAK